MAADCVMGCDGREPSGASSGAGSPRWLPVPSRTKLLPPQGGRCSSVPYQHALRLPSRSFSPGLSLASGCSQTETVTLRWVPAELHVPPTGFRQPDHFPRHQEHGEGRGYSSRARHLAPRGPESVLSVRPRTGSPPEVRLQGCDGLSVSPQGPLVSALGLFPRTFP